MKTWGDLRELSLPSTRGEISLSQLFLTEQIHSHLLKMFSCSGWCSLSAVTVIVRDEVEQVGLPYSHVLSKCPLPTSLGCATGWKASAESTSCRGGRPDQEKDTRGQQYRSPGAGHACHKQPSVTLAGRIKVALCNL